MPRNAGLNDEILSGFSESQAPKSDGRRHKHLRRGRRTALHLACRPGLKRYHMGNSCARGRAPPGESARRGYENFSRRHAKIPETGITLPSSLRSLRRGVRPQTPFLRWAPERNFPKGINHPAHGSRGTSYPGSRNPVLFLNPTGLNPARHGGDRKPRESDATMQRPQRC